MTDETKVSNPADTLKQPKEKVNRKPAERNLNDAFKFGVFCVRAILAAATGKTFGDASVDAALGDAFASIHSPHDLADQGLAYNIVLSGAAGAWKAVEGDREWE
jgi:hypothetical protein